MYEKENNSCLTEKKLDYAQEVYNILMNLNPEEKRRALRGAEEKIHIQFEKRQINLQEEARQLEEEWNLFKNS